MVCIGGGPSLTAADVDACRGRARVLAINDAYRLAPWADVLYGCDAKWWTWHPEAAAFAGLKYGLTHRREDVFPDGVELLANTGMGGLETSPHGVRIGSTLGSQNSGYQAINLAMHLGAVRVLLLGYDMQPDERGRSHWFGEHPVAGTSQYRLFAQAFERLVEPLKAFGIAVINCTRRTALTCFPCQPLAEALGC